MSQNGANRGPCKGSPALGVRLADPLAFCQWGSAIGRAPMAEPPRWGAPGPRLASSVRLFAPFPSVFGLFLKCRYHIDVILTPLRSSLRYGRNGYCFVRFEGRL